MTSRWLCAAALLLAATGCTSLCDGDTVALTMFASTERYGKGIAKCLETGECASLCADLFDVPAPIDRCAIVSLVWPDARVQPMPPKPRAVDVAALHGVNVQATFTEQVACTIDDSNGDDSWDWDWDDDDGDYDDGGDDDGGGDGCWDCGDDDGGDDDGGDDDDGGTYGDPVRAPTEAPRA